MKKRLRLVALYSEPVDARGPQPVEPMDGGGVRLGPDAKAWEDQYRTLAHQWLSPEPSTTS
jgi:hypothetical protein